MLVGSALKVKLRLKELAELASKLWDCFPVELVAL
jgi:hypothetical protein